MFCASWRFFCVAQLFGLGNVINLSEIVSDSLRCTHTLKVPMVLINLFFGGARKGGSGNYTWDDFIDLKVSRADI